ncbi:YcxB family protein [Streptomyces sp. NPDC086023]|uniref:YcxB family protein n=1 Tax=Streptomyces sp. NPDC086023 TaxID=3365746 RepID=UPI0037D348AD
MNTGGEQGVVAPVELRYRPVAEDMVRALKVRAGTTPAGRRTRYAPVVAVAAAALYVWLKARDGVPFDPSVIGVVTGVAAFCVLLWLGPRLAARQLHRLAAGHGEYRAVVDGEGVTVTSAGGSQFIPWGAQPRYVETAELFVMLSPDRNAVGITVLPKRGLQGPADLDRLRRFFEQSLGPAAPPA